MAVRVLLCAVVTIASSSPAAVTSFAASTITYVQSAYNDPQTPSTTVTVKYAAAQVAGDLNVVVVGWNDSTTTVATVTDTKINTYTRAVGPTVLGGFGSQSIYYAKNIFAAAAGANTVTVTFAAAASFPDIRILEYSGADPNNPVDVTAASTGSSAATSSGAATTTNATDLIFGANLVESGATGPGASFTRRIQTDPDADMAEDRMVTTVGSYSATGPISPSARWIMQMVAIRTPVGGDTTPPTAPTNLTAALSGNQVSLAWTASTDNVGVTGYLLERCLGSACSTFAQIATPATNSYLDTPATPGSYSYRVRATDAAANLSGYSNVATQVVPDTTPPTAPSGLTATASGTTINLAWTASTDNVGVTGYFVERCTGAACSTFAQIAAPTSNSYSDPGLSIGSYSYRVRATDAAANLSGYSAVATRSISDTIPPTAPANLAASLSGNQVSLTWDASTDNVGVTGYRVERCQGAACASFAQIATPTTNSYLDTPATPGSYSYRVRATDAAANLSGYSNVATQVIADTTPPTTPSGLTATPAGGQMNLAWTASTDNVGVTGYLVERCQGAACSTFAQIATPTSNSYADPGLTIGSYSYRVRATDAAANLSGYSNVATGAISDTTPPTAPTNLTATLNSNQVSLSWTASTDNVGVTGYLLERCQGAGCASFAQIATPATTSFTDTPATPGSYSYRVRATDAASNLSGYSNVATQTIADTQPPTAPSGLTATASGTTINLAWTASTDNVGVSAYLVERCQGPSCASFAQVTTTTAASYSDKNLAIDTFSYRVRATDAAGNLSPYSNVVSASTTSAPATLLAGYPFSEGSGTTTADVSPNAITGTLQSATWTTSGKFGDALSFNGTTSFVDLGRPAPLTTVGSMTWEAWVFPTGVPGDDGQIIALSNGNGGWQFKTTPDTGPRTIGVAVAGSTSAQRYGKTVLGLNTWYHLAGVYNAAAQTLDVYVNGVLDNGTLSGTVPATQTLPAGVNVNIGRRTGGFNFIGTIDEARIYGRALSQAEIQADMITPVGAPSDTTPPTNPTGLGATTISGSEIDLAWTASTDNIAVTGYLLERCQGTGCVNFAQISSPKKTSFNDTGLTPNTPYSYRVRATDAANNLSGYSNIASANTQAPAPPTAPSNLIATPSSISQVNLSWGASTADLGVASYSIERCQTAGCANFAVVGSSTTTTFSDTGLLSNTSYTYQVRALDTASNPGPYSNPATAVTPAPQPPTAPSNLTASAVNSTQINLAWTASTSSIGLANYIVQRCQGAGCSSFATIASPTTTTYNDTAVTTGTSYNYQVQAVDTANNHSTFSNTATATPQNGLVAAYGMNEGMGTITNDVSGNGINGTLQSAGWTTNGKYGNAITFDGATSFVDLGSPVALQGTGSATWEAWVFPTGSPGDDGQILAMSNDLAGWQLKTTVDTGPRTFGLAVSGASGSNTQRYGKTVIALNTWYHVAGVYNATARTMDLYVNGVLDNNTVVGVIPAQQVIPTGVNANIGRRSGGFYFIGTIDEARIYSRALSAAEIQSDMATPLPQPIASASPPSLDFGSQAFNTSSAPQIITLTNTGSAGLTVSGVNIVGSGGSSYGQTNTCTGSLAPGGNCTITVTFTPTASGTLAGTVVITDNASNPHNVSVTGVGIGGPMSVTPRTATLTPILSQQFTASGSNVVWSVDDVVGGTAATGTITTTGLYTPPSTAGNHTVKATDSIPGDTGSAIVYVSTFAGTFTRDNGQQRIGLNATETVLTPNNVNSTRFGKLLNYPIDGVSDASPLYVANLAIPGKGAHNVVFVATEHNSVFAFDAEGSQTAPLWQVSFINPANGVTTVPPGDTGECCDIAPEIGITGTPVIDPATNTLYVVAKTKEVTGGNATYVHRLHALDLSTGAEKMGGPVVIQASVPGTGNGSSNGILPFIPLHENQRSALLLLNGIVYVAFGSHGDVWPYHGWVLGYNATTLAQTMIYCTSPNTPGSGSGVWQSGDGLATDGTGNIYFVSGEGLFNVNTGGKEWGDTFIKLSPSGTVLDYFTPHDQAVMDSQNFDFGSAGALLLPDQAGAHPHLAITAGKTGTIYVIDRDAMGHFNANNDSQIVQVLPNMFPHGDQATGNFKAPVYWNGHAYFSADADFIKMFDITNGLLSTAPVSQTSFVANYPGATLGLSANGLTNGILWAIQRVDLDPFGGGVKGPGVLHAFDANNLGTELYNSSQNGTRDQLDMTAKWAAPLIANGRVFVASLTQLTVYGELP